METEDRVRRRYVRASEALQLEPELDLKKLLRALQAVRDGDFTVRLPGDQVGIAGKRLSAAQRQKIGVARALLKRPDYAIFKRPLSALDPRGQEEIVRAVLALARDPERPFGIIWVLSDPQIARLFDKVAVFEHGVLTEFGPPQELIEKGGAFTKILA